MGYKQFKKIHNFFSVITNIILNGIYLFVSPPEDFVVFEPEDEPGAVVKVKLSTGDLHLGDASLLP